MAAFYLASASPRRRELLQQIGMRFETLLLRGQGPRGADVDERRHDSEPVEDYCQRVAVAKAEAGVRAVGARVLVAKPVLAADTVVAVDGEVLGKPVSADQAAAFLRRLSGRTHQVRTVVALASHLSHGLQLWTATSVTTVTFRPLTESEIQHYGLCGEGVDKAGGYAIQGRAATFVEWLEGSYSGVVGLPLYETAMLLARAGIHVL